MFLYDIKGKSLDVYEMSATQSDLIKYREEKIKEIPENKRIFVAETKISPYGTSPLFERVDDGNTLCSTYADNKNRIKYDVHKHYHALETDKRSEKNNKKLINCYLNGDFKDSCVISVQYKNQILKYYLLCSEHYMYFGEYDGGKHYLMENIIQLSKTLFILQLIEKGRFDLLESAKADYSEQLELYSLSKINEVSIEELQKMDACGITENAYSKVISKADNDSHVLKLLKPNK